MKPEYHFRVLFRDDSGYYCELSGGKANSQHEAETIAKRYTEKSGIASRVVNNREAVLWDSANI